MNFKTIRFRILALGAGLMIADIIFRFVLALPFAQDTLHRLVDDQQLSIASYIARDVEHSVESRRALIAQLARTLPVELLHRPKELGEWLEERRRLHPLFAEGMLLIDPQGKRIPFDGEAGSPDSKQNFSESAWFQAALAAEVSVIGRPERSSTSGKPIIVMSAAVRDANRQPVAVLGGVADLSADGFLRDMQENQFGHRGGFLLISPQDQVFIGSSVPEMILKPTPPPGVNLLHDRAMAGYRGTGVTVNAQGIEELSAMASVPGTGWFVVARIPTREAFRPVNTLKALIVQSTTVAVVAIMALLLLLLPRILRPLTESAQAMREMADGKRKLEALPIERDDEVGGLVRGFNYLLAKLRENEAVLKESEERLSFLAHHDTLTGLYNRQMLESRLDYALDLARRNGTCFALLFCDLDRFKPINDEHGHSMGDAVLIQVAQRFLLGRRSSDTVARLGGDEFVVLLTNLTDPCLDAERLAREYMASICAPYSVGDHAFTLSVSIGIALYTGEPVSGSQLMTWADTAMYQAKRAGRSRICVFGETSGDMAPGSATVPV
ncbi:MAG TPA: diguanylate cyclase [Burkholderiaceae bacterium]|nr:diguanylate cyclase [Burkholderiaceae bacterium]